MELVDVVDEVIAVLISTPASVPVHVGVCPLTQTALCGPPAVNVIVPLLPIAVVVVAFRTICEGVRLIDVSSISPSIDVIAVTELYVADALSTSSALETAVAVNAVIVAGFAASSPAVLHVSTIAAWFPPVAEPESVIVMVSAAIVVVVVMALVRVGVDPA
tara:strand:- start:28 stop:510 length:483 start_codon:yes stop_codon:yes gene_type:complete